MLLDPDAPLLYGQYRILRQLGRGGFGSVYPAQDTLLGEQAAIKELIPALVGDEAMLKRFLAEARATMRLTHKHIGRTHNVFSEGSYRTSSNHSVNPMDSASYRTHKGWAKVSDRAPYASIGAPRQTWNAASVPE